MKIYDMHIHSFNKPAERDNLLSEMASAGVYGGCVFSNWPYKANNQLGTSFEERMEEVLSICSGAGDRLFPVLWIHPYEEGIFEKIHIAKARGIRAFKIICTDFYVYEEPVLKLLSEIAKIGMPVIFHTGILWDGQVSSSYNRPLNWEALLHIEGLRFSVGHCSWPWIDECIALYGKFLNAKTVGSCAEMFFDITPGTPEIYRKELLSKLFTIGYNVGDNIFFGTDASADSYRAEWVESWLSTDRKILDELGVSLAEREKIYSKNILRFLGVLGDEVEIEAPVCDNSHKWSANNPEVPAIIEKWYKRLGFGRECDKDFYRMLKKIPISDALSIEYYDMEEEDLKRNLLSYLFMCEKTAEKYRELGIPDSVRDKTLSDITRWAYTWFDMRGELCLGELSWLRRHLSAKLFQLGRLQFCMAEAEWDIPALSVKAGDPIIEVHIPADGPLVTEECKRSIDMAREFFAKYFPDYKYKAFTCHSWLLDGELKSILPEGSNILGFRDLFEIVFDEESNEILRYVFKRTTNPHNLPSAYPTSSFAERVKKAVLSGVKFHESYGFIK